MVINWFSRSQTTVLLAGIALGASGCAKPDHAVPAPTRPVAMVRLAPTATATAPTRIPATIQSAQRAELASRLSATVKQVHVAEGQRVTRGARLVTLDSHDLQQQLTAAGTLRETSRAQLRRVDELLATGVVATRDREQAQTQLAAAEAAVAAIEAQLDYAEVRAPFSGVVQARHVDQGDLAAPGRVLITLEGPEQLELVATLSLTEATGLAVGSPVRFDSESVSGAAQITALATSGDPLTHRQLLRARVTEASGPLRAGSFARIQLDRVPGADSRRPNLSVPLGVLVERGELTGVFVVEDGHATLRWIQLGARDGDRVLVRAGLSQHDQVIANPASLRDGQPVEVER